MTNETKTLVDNATKGSLRGKSIEAAMELLEEMAANTYQWPSKCNTPKMTLGVHKLDVLTTLSSKVVTLPK